MKNNIGRTTALLLALVLIIVSVACLASCAENGGESDYAQLQEKLDELEGRVAALEEQATATTEAPTTTTTETTTTTTVKYTGGNGGTGGGATSPTNGDGFGSDIGM